MSIFARTTLARSAKTKESQQVAYIYAMVLVILVLCQLFTFDKFQPLIQTFLLPGGEVMAKLVSSIIVTSEVFALPFLLGLSLSPLTRVVSMVFGWAVPFIWLSLSLWLLFTTNVVANIGFLGTLVNLLPGWWAVFINIAIVLMSAWASWGLWPGKRK